MKRLLSVIGAALCLATNVNAERALIYVSHVYHRLAALPHRVVHFAEPVHGERTSEG
jgi:hypothetical protein